MLNHITEIRHKAIVIPKIGKKYVVVNDTKNNELTFVVGGCKLKEINDISLCAMRELSEETRNVFNKTNIKNFKYLRSFKYTKRSQKELEKNIQEAIKEGKDHKTVVMMYHIFLCFPKNDTDFEKLKMKYHRSKSINNETNDIFLMTKKELQNANMWSFMKRHVLTNI